jgi:dipeptidyl aminopeptidase/acylaminoacyl peptidase
MLSSLNVFRHLAALVKPLAVSAVLGASSFGLWQFAIGGLIMGGGAGSVGFPAATDDATPRIVVSEFGTTEDTLWSAPADDPSQRTIIATVRHAPEYGILASVSPDGRLIAYTVLPPSQPKASADAPAEVWVLDSSGGEPRRLAEDADLLIAPVWSPDSASVVFRRSESRDNVAGTFHLVRVELSGRETELIEMDVGLFPVGFSPDGADLYYTEVSSDGTELARVQADTLTTATIAHLSDDFTRDWHLSPDASRLSFLAPEVTSETPSFRAMVVDTDSGAGPTPVRKETTGDFNPIWHPNSRDLTLGQEPQGGESEAALRVSALGGAPEELEAPDKGFDVPLSWSPDGSYLALRSFEGSSALEPGRAEIAILRPNGEREELKIGGELSLAGWLPER